jgi:uncharacterized protein (DUF433 family)
MRWQDRIERNPRIMLGKPVIRGTRITVELILERLGDGWTVDDLLRSFPTIKADDIRAAQAYAAASLGTDEITFLSETG